MSPPAPLTRSELFPGRNGLNQGKPHPKLPVHENESGICLAGMSRVRNAVRSLVSGYAGIGANVLYTLASVPLALHYLSKDEFGLWALVTQITGYLLLIDLGMTGAVARFLIDHKDHPETGEYGSVIKTGSLVFLIQGACIALGGFLLSFWLPQLLDVPRQYAALFRLLVAAQCGMAGAFFVARILMGLLQAHQRFDVIGYTGIAQMAVGFGVQWLTFHRGWKLYSLLAAYFAGLICGLMINLAMVLRLRLLPPARYWGNCSMKAFKEVFAYGNDLFLCTVGGQLLNASQVIIISRTLGVSAAAIWTVATKSFQVAFQFVQRIFDFSASALAEMMVRNERVNLRRRFRDVIVLSASFAVFAGACLAVCNGIFLLVWTKGKVSWPWWNDALLGLLLIFNCVSRCYVGMAGYAKQLKTMRWVYFLEGASFVVAASLIAPQLGISGIILVAILANLVWSGSYGLRWARDYLDVSIAELLGHWFGPAYRYFLAMLVLTTCLWWLNPNVPPAVLFAVKVAIMGVGGMSLLWFSGLSRELHSEAKARLRSFFDRKALVIREKTGEGTQRNPPGT